MKKLILLVLILTVLFCGQAYAGASSYKVTSPVYLVVMSSTNTSNSVFNYVYHKVDSWELCFSIIENSRIDIPISGDAEASIAMYCTAGKGMYRSNNEMRNQKD